MDTTETKTLALIAVRAAALGLAATGQGAASQALLLLASAAESGANIDAHMAEVARKLKAGVALDDALWADLTARIQAASAELHKD
jgi:hypothetical protein